MDREPHFLTDVLKLGLGVALGLLLVWAAFEYRARYELRRLEVQADAAVMQMDRQLERAREARHREAERKRSLEQSQAAAKAASEAARRRKEAAWERFYHPSEECLATTSVECGNAYMRARREFEASYQNNDR